jgi:hypothetical protein
MNRFDWVWIINVYKRIESNWKINIDEKAIKDCQKNNLTRWMKLKIHYKDQNRKNESGFHEIRRRTEIPLDKRAKLFGVFVRIKQRRWKGPDQ